jgi:hypothetical protein
MTLARWSIPSPEITQRVRFRLLAGAAAASRAVLWERDGRRVLLHVSSLRAVMRDGWLLVNLTLQTEPTGPRTLQFVFFLGSDGEGDGTQAGATIHCDSREAAQLAQLWGDDLQRTIWDGVLDVIEGTVVLAERHHRGRSLAVLGFSSSADQLHVDILATEST